VASNAKGVVMDDVIAKKLEQRLGRRSFLRGSALAAATFHVFGVSSVIARAQEPQRGADSKQQDQDQEKQQVAPNQDKAPDSSESHDKTTDQPSQSKDADDPYKVTHLDEKGREYRMCPVCGFNMYRQDHTWTCENCGYSYEE
jgi:secreted PhoX family phosphatase